MALLPGDSQLADRNNFPLIGQAQSAITNPVVDGEVAAAIASLNVAVVAVLDALRAHGLVKS